MPYKDPQRQKQALHEFYLKKGGERKKWYRDFMENKSCAYCPESTTVCLDWHHIDPSSKKGEIARMVKTRHPMEKVFEELEKCICVCANCHRKIHAGLIEVSSGRRNRTAADRIMRPGTQPFVFPA